ncbi:G-box-binding factor 1-like isoform X2 [Prosopis cineraria]|uniref:G-box-binding factor 1-like isoform X2 n=1 Tax=Prosopis cineraria TaxID=364024 RepID=UPI0024103B3E|nr:G-box-binding factor 1-like isoform X2 [Prosopis cineraria]
MVQDETENKPLQPHWSTSIQGYHYSMQTPTTPIINSHVAAAGSYYYPHIWPNQVVIFLIYDSFSKLLALIIMKGQLVCFFIVSHLVQAVSTSLQYDPLHDPRRIKNHPIVAGGFLLTFSDKDIITFSIKNMDFMETYDGNLQPRSSVFEELRENGNELSISKNEQDGGAWSGTSGSMGSSDEDHDTDNGFPSSREKQCNVMPANRNLTQSRARIENCNTDQVNSTEPNLNSGTGLNISGTIRGPAKLDEDEIRKERKRQLNRESARRSRLRRQQECDELRKIVDDLVKNNSLLKDKLMSLSEDCLELNNENNSIEEEITKIYGIESIADLIAMRPGGVTH